MERSVEMIPLCCCVERRRPVEHNEQDHSDGKDISCFAVEAPRICMRDLWSHVVVGTLLQLSGFPRRGVGQKGVGNCERVEHGIPEARQAYTTPHETAATFQ